MLSVVAMAADLKTGVTYKGTWADIENAYTPVEGEIKVTKTDDGLKFEVKNHIFNGYAFPDYTVDYKIDVTEDGSFNDESGLAHAVLGDNASTEGNAIILVLLLTVRTRWTLTTWAFSLLALRLLSVAVRAATSSRTLSTSTSSS